MTVALWNYHSWPLDVGSNSKLSFLTTRCQQQCETFHSSLLDVSSNYVKDFEISTVDHQMSVAMWNFHSSPPDVSSNVKFYSWPLDVSSNVKIVILDH